MAEIKSLTFGTGEQVDVRIDDKYVSTRHARIWQDEQGQFWVEDLGSTNGTWIGRLYLGQRVYGPTRLLPGQVLWMGRTQIPWTA